MMVTLIICVNYADNHGWLTRIELQQKSSVHQARVILKVSTGKATQVELALTANILLTTVMYNTSPF